MSNGKWLGKAAVLWALDEAPDVPAHLVAALVAVARYAGEDGRGAHPSALTVAARIRKTERSAKKDLAALRRLGLLLSGDQRIVAMISADKRPFVYDLPMLRGVAQDTPSGGSGVSHRVERGAAQGHNGVSHTTPEEIHKRSRRSPRDAAGASAPPRAQPDMPPWCRRCHPETRMLAVGDELQSCPECHPDSPPLALALTPEQVAERRDAREKVAQQALSQMRAVLANRGSAP